ncbi:MAG: PQQ-binding-like beta-propeller repeat protein, partial [Pirellulaceae bacterium]|nr:PQQ-binding-like beta-propeller repeat protein [Pirellulaceae bacterium]
NRLAAYNFETGKILWSIPAMEPLVNVPASEVKNTADQGGELDVEKPFENVGFMGAPVGFGDLLLVPVNVSGSIFLYALDSQRQGALVWRSFLCDEPGGGSQPWSPIHVAIEGSTAYVNCGSGVVFAVDAMTGSIRFARRYPRTGETNNYLARFGGNAEILELDGWQEDVVIPVGNELITLASDYNVVWAIDRQTAEFRWKTDNRPFGKKYDYLIGANEDYLFLGSSNSIAAISIRAQGRWEWVYNFDDKNSLGRAMLTENAIYVPVENQIIKLGLDGNQGAGDVQATIPVRLGVDAPLGNLYSDGKRIWVVGANRLYALDEMTSTDLEPNESTTDEDVGEEVDTSNLRLDVGLSRTDSELFFDGLQGKKVTVATAERSADDTP